MTLPIGGAIAPSEAEVEALRTQLPAAAAPPGVSGIVGPKSILESENQRHAGSCVAYGMLRAAQVLTYEQVGFYFQASEMFTYAEGRRVGGLINQDIGMFMADASRAINDAGICRKQYAPYDPDRVVGYQPSTEAYRNAATHRVRYSQLRGSGAVLGALAGLDGGPARGVAIQHGVDDGFQRLPADGIWRRPSQPVFSLPNHVTTCVGADTDRGLLVCMNQWSGWGAACPDWFRMRCDTFMADDYGFFMVPIEALDNPEWIVFAYAPEHAIPGIEAA